MKNLKTGGNKIESYEVQKTTEKLKEIAFDVVHLTVVSEGRTYKYRVCADDREPDLDVTKNRLEEELKNSIENFEKFEVKNKEREYLFINKKQYTGRQLI